MSLVPHGAVAPSPSELNFEGLTKRLLALRGEIDTILAELANAAAPTPSGIGMAHLEIEEQTLIEVCAAASLHEPTTGSLTDGESTAEAHVTTETADVSPEPTALADEVEPTQTSALTVAAAPEQPATAPADEEPIEVARAVHESESAAMPGNDLAPAMAADANPGNCLDSTGPCLEVTTPSIADAASSGMDIQAQQHPAIEPSQVAVDPPTIAANAPAQPVTDAPSAAPLAATRTPPADAAVLSLDAHRRRQKCEPAATIATPVRKRPRVAGRIAACILALLAAAAVLLMADRTALGNVLSSVQSLPWVSELPSYLPNAADWPFARERRAAGQVSDGMTLGEISASEDAVLARYREVWPTGS